ncbi:MAG: ABC transporter ATP-binding protein [Thermincola sp.]|jgi:branched-chain amino acid transport system ATP-binding protein|nr:ABC transporter ATP-binding protein [Thermincola sp.]MDT3702527.1 ABC transporter ATP-binding protein [Thermincola sp.]
MSKRNHAVPDYWPRRNEVLPSFPKHHEQKGKQCLRADGLNLSFGGIKAISGVSLEAKMGEIHALVGPNGAGKSSLLNCINGLYRPQQGSVWFDGQSISGLAPHKVAALGIGRSFQRLALFKGLTVLENIMVGRHLFIKAGLLSGALYWGKGSREDVRNQALAEEIIEFLEIQHLRDKPVRELAYGMQKRVEFGRALAVEPKLLLLDEPVAGMNHEEKEDIARFILDIQEELGTAIILIEHELDMVMDISDRVTVLSFGQVIANGKPQEVVANPAVAEAYLGKNLEKEGNEDGSSRIEHHA